MTAVFSVGRVPCWRLFAGLARHRDNHDVRVKELGQGRVISMAPESIKAGWNPPLSDRKYTKYVFKWSIFHCNLKMRFVLYTLSVSKWFRFRTFAFKDVSGRVV